MGFSDWLQVRLKRSDQTLIMWQSILFFLCFVVSRGTAHDIKVVCEEPDDLNGSPSQVAGLKVELVTVGHERMLNISWAINIDESLQTTPNNEDKMFSSYSAFEILPEAPMTPVSVVVVYPSVTPAFQQAVVALAEFLQWHGGCRVTIDMWQQGKIAELGPLRWLAEQVKGADRVLIVSPQPSSMLAPCTPTSSLPKHSIPAATGDLYPLILNMVASHARSSTELAKFWVVQLNAEKDKSSCVLLPELQTCRAFCLMKDLNRLCKSLHSQRKVGKKISSLLFKHKILYSQNSTTKLREAVEMLSAKKPVYKTRLGIQFLEISDDMPCK
ncbi:hypothetical protein CCH79_00010564 [Gambusia affinis]|uniref:SEFIR domain-containing protein n=1 Tax=Gambusia affinis TaxID=33528 RepID=A0A315W5L4_GAMAF|nr:hypothetical protein CCH79_00010564 [Gambusia affinis]